MNNLAKNERMTKGIGISPMLQGIRDVKQSCKIIVKIIIGPWA